MTPRLTITNLQPASSPITDPVTKFGGQPTWLTEPQWPISEAWDVPMRFLCQIEIPSFLSSTRRLAYIFVTHPDFGEDFFDPDIIFPDGGENAVILQPGGTYGGETQALVHGPTLYLKSGQPAEFEVELCEQNDPAFIPREEYVRMGADPAGAYFEAIQGNKIGGIPAFFQGDEWPSEGSWNLLLQLETNRLPFHFNLGASPLAFAFVNQQCTEGRFLVQDS